MKNSTMRFRAMYLLLAFSVSTFSQEVATIDITTYNKDIEIVVDGKSIGYHDHISISVPPGRHMIEGRKPHFFTDWEKVRSSAGKTDTETLNPRYMHFTLSLQMQPFFLFNGDNTPMISIDPGVRFWPLYLGIHLSEPLLTSSPLLFGAHVDYLYDYKNLVEVTLGAFVTYYQFDRDAVYDDNGASVVTSLHAIGGSVCPEFSVLGGREHFFFLFGISGIIYHGFCPMISLGFVVSP